MSCIGEIGTIPVRLTSPRVGFTPTIPQALAGLRIEPSVSDPTASGASPAATEAAEPELEPDGLRPVPCGFTVWPPSVLQPLLECRERKFAHSDRFALPSTTAPAARSRPTRNASPWPESRSAGEPAVAGSPSTAMLSLISTGRPVSGPPGVPFALASSLARACAAASSLTVMTARSRGLSRSIRAR